jgi:hypothetical protein
MRKAALRLAVPTPVNGTVPPRRKPNSETRDREHLTEAEVERLMKAAGENRYGHRDATMNPGCLPAWPTAGRNDIGRRWVRWTARAY